MKAEIQDCGQVVVESAPFTLSLPGKPGLVFLPMGNVMCLMFR